MRLMVHHLAVLCRTVVQLSGVIGGGSEVLVSNPVRFQ